MKEENKTLSVKTPVCQCTGCGHMINRAGSMGEGLAPYAGAGSICMYCGHIMIFNDDMTLREATDAERSAIEELPDYRLYLQATKIFGPHKKIQHH